MVLRGDSGLLPECFKGPKQNDSDEQEKHSVKGGFVSHRPLILKQEINTHPRSLVILLMQQVLPPPQSD